jgi:membrane protein implicated in regulation of membrane protease activity
MVNLLLVALVVIILVLLFGGGILLKIIDLTIGIIGFLILLVIAVWLLHYLSSSANKSSSHS